MMSVESTVWVLMPVPCPSSCVTTERTTCCLVADGDVAVSALGVQRASVVGSAAVGSSTQPSLFVSRALSCWLKLPATYVSPESWPLTVASPVSARPLSEPLALESPTIVMGASIGVPCGAVTTRDGSFVRCWYGRVLKYDSTARLLTVVVPYVVAVPKTGVYPSVLFPLCAASHLLVV